MKESKKIERLFQEKFKDFEATPPSNSWNAVASKMNSTEKEKKKLPFFFTLSHIAASIVLCSAHVKISTCGISSLRSFEHKHKPAT